jgi:hypothetical protein
VDYWIVNVPDRCVEVYREPVSASTAPIGWRHGRSITLEPDERVTPIAAPPAVVVIADLLP